VYYEMLDVVQPLGAGAGTYEVDLISTVHVGDKMKEKRIVRTGAKRVATLPTGTTESKLLHTTEPSLIIWQQVSTNLRGVNMHGAGKGDEPGLKIELETTATGNATRVKLDYFFAELSEACSVLCAPRWTGINAQVLAQHMIEEMRQRGYETTDGKSGDAPPPPTAAKPPNPAALPPATPLPAPSRAPAPAAVVVDVGTVDKFLEAQGAAETAKAAAAKAEAEAAKQRKETIANKSKQWAQSPAGGPPAAAKPKPEGKATPKWPPEPKGMV